MVEVQSNLSAKQTQVRIFAADGGSSLTDGKVKDIDRRSKSCHSQHPVRTPEGAPFVMVEVQSNLSAKQMHLRIFAADGGSSLTDGKVKDIDHWSKSCHSQHPVRTPEGAPFVMVEVQSNLSAKQTHLRIFTADGGTGES